MSNNKTVPNNLNVANFLIEIEDEQKRIDMYSLLSMMKKITN